MKIPTYREQVRSPELPGPELPGPRVPLAAGEALGREVAQFNASIAQVERHIEESRQNVLTAQFLTGLRSKAQDLIDHPDTTMPAETYAGKVKEVLTQEADAHLQSIGNVLTRDRTQAHVTDQIGQYALNARHAANVSITGQIVASAEQQTHQGAQQAALAATPSERMEIETTIGDLWDGLALYGIVRPEIAFQKRTQFLHEADSGAVLIAGEMNPLQVSSDLLEQTMDVAGAITYRNYPNLTINERVALARTLHAKAHQHELETDRLQKKQTDAIVGQIGQEIVKVTGPVDEDAFYARVTGRGYEAWHHVNAMIESKKRQLDVSTHKASTEMAAGFENEMYDAYHQGKDFFGIVKRAQLSPMNEAGKDQVWKLYTRLDGLAEASERRADAGEDRKKKQEAETMRRNLRTAMNEFDSYFPSPKDPAMLMMFGDYATVRAHYRGVITQAAESGQDPVKVARDNRPAAILAIYQQATNAINARQPQLLSRGFKTKEDIERANLPEAEKDRLKALAIELYHLKRFITEQEPARK